MNTPDMEWEKEFDGRMTSLSRYGGFYHGNKSGVELYDFNNIKAFIKELLSSRDTYWKERTAESVIDGYKLAVKHLEEAYQANATTTVPETIEWLKDNARLYHQIDSD